jgi:hypothetical protein
MLSNITNALKIQPVGTDENRVAQRALYAFRHEDFAIAAFI